MAVASNAGLSNSTRQAHSAVTELPGGFRIRILSSRNAQSLSDPNAAARR